MSLVHYGEDLKFPSCSLHFLLILMVYYKLDVITFSIPDVVPRVTVHFILGGDQVLFCPGGVQGITVWGVLLMCQFCYVHSKSCIGFGSLGICYVSGLCYNS